MSFVDTWQKSYFADSQVGFGSVTAINLHQDNRMIRTKESGYLTTALNV